MKVAMVSEHASPLAALGGQDAGGQNVHVAALSAALARRGVQVVVYTRRDHPDLPHRVRVAPGVAVEHVDAGPARPVPKDEMWPYMREFAGHLERAWAVGRPDVVHGHFWMSGWASLEAARPLDLPVLQTFHALGVVKRRYQGAADPSPPERPGVERQLVAEADRIVATCSEEVFELLRLGAELRRVAVVPCGVDAGLFRPDVPAAEPRHPGGRLLAVGRLVERKGIDDVIAALTRLPEAELLVAGGPPAEELDGDPEARRLLAVAERLGVAGRVRLLGRVEHRQVPALMRSADVVVCAPWYEPFGIVPLEAMACGVPVVAAAVGGLVDTVVDGRTGVLVPPGEPEAVAAAVAGLLADPARARALGRAGVSRVMGRYGWDRIAGSTLASYYAVAGRAVAQGGRRGGVGW